LVRRGCVVAAIAAAAFGGCVSGGGPVAPDESQPSLLSRLFPNADGNSWTFDYVDYIAAETYAVPEAISRPVDEISYAEVEALLMEAPPLPDASEYFRAGTLELRFDGRIATPAGPKQHLRDTLIVDDGARAGFSASERVRRALRKARGDAFAPLASPTRLWGFSAFEKKDGWIGFYDESRRDSAFTLIKAPIEPGEFFRHQFRSWGLIDETMWEYAWIAGSRSIETSNGLLIEDAIVIIYVVHWSSRGFDGIETWASDTYSAVIIYFAPDVGPVYQRSLGFFSTDPARPELRRILYSEAKLREFTLVAER